MSARDDGESLDVCAVGYVTRDIIRIAGRPAHVQPGGAVTYAAVALASLGARTGVVTKVAARDADALLSDLRRRGIAVVRRESARTAFFENIYPTGDPDRREQVAGPAPRAFAPEDLAGVRARALLLDPLTRVDGFAAFLRAAAGRAGLVALDAQALVRKFFRPGVARAARERALEGLRFVDIFKAEREEAETLTGERDPARAAAALARRGAGAAIVTLGSRGSVVHDGTRTHRIPALRPVRVVDATGCGDTYLAGFLFARLEGAGVEEAGRFAAALATLKLERDGPFTGTRAEVRRRLRARRPARRTGA